VRRMSSRKRRSFLVKSLTDRNNRHCIPLLFYQNSYPEAQTHNDDDDDDHDDDDDYYYDDNNDTLTVE